MKISGHERDKESNLGHHMRNFVIYTSHLALSGQSETHEATMNWLCSWGGKECLQNFGEESSWKTAIHMTKDMDIRERGCENGHKMNLAQDHVQWLSLLSAVLNLQVLLLQSYLL
jgi:hypothetical protein